MRVGVTGQIRLRRSDNRTCPVIVLYTIRIMHIIANAQADVCIAMKAHARARITFDADLSCPAAMATENMLHNIGRMSIRREPPAFACAAASGNVTPHVIVSGQT
jgi:hypothetical protein